MRRNRVLTRGDHDELEIFLEIRLIAFTNRSKVQFEREKYIGFIEEIGLEIVGDGAGRERGFAVSRVRFRGHGSWLQCRDGLAQN